MVRKHIKLKYYTTIINKIEYRNNITHNYNAKYISRCTIKRYLLSTRFNLPVSLDF